MAPLSRQYLTENHPRHDGWQATPNQQQIVVLAGATWRADMTDSIPESAKKNRERFDERINEDWALQGDTLFTSPSVASSFLIGSSTSGKVYWKKSDGISLGALEQIELNATISDT